MFSKNKREELDSRSNLILGMVLLQDEESVEIEDFKKDQKMYFHNSISDLSGESGSFAFRIANELVAVGHMPMPVPRGDLEGTAKYAYNWKTALEDLKGHKSHLFVTIMSGGVDQVKRFKIFTQVLCSLLRTTNSIGIYKGSQSLLIPKDAYLSIAGKMTDDHLPLYLWIYFGYRMTEQGNSGYTYGLREFGKSEMEIIDSTRTIGEIEEFLFNIAHYVLDYNVIFKDGQTCGVSADERIAISYSKGNFVGGETFKLAY
ncbi:MAG: DUF4261 domain-containing protein [Bacteroidota bacterium]|nr:DUF4261 domain-containing protein [Bacteroidota bacterium]MDP4247518.1 DUF4261 domain-containing protein [Bacteroidota bacterium]MDP4254671.1 DUF4261 domain-containing protein [Bacteroidota bacterium]MDP4260270.1 DUF4261 domain-containing protein [Bacteroidota bacterium]